VTRRNNKLDSQNGSKQSGLPSDLPSQTILFDPFSPNSSQNISTCIHWSLNKNNSYTHKSAEQNTKFKTYTLPFMKISRQHNLSGSNVFIKNQTSIKVWPLRSELSVFTRSFEPLTRSPTECNNACFPSLCWTKNLWSDYPRVQNVIWKHLTLNSLYHAC